MFRNLVLGVILLAVVWNLTGSEPYFPMQPGNFWEYRTLDGKHEFSIRGFTPLSANGKIYYFVNGFASRQLTLREEIGQGLMQYDGETPGELLFTSFSQDQPQFTAPDRGCGIVTGRVEPNRVAADLPVGHFPRALQITYDTPACAEPVIQSEYFVANVGLVRRIVKIGDELRQYDLVSARVGGQVMLADTNSSVTALTWEEPKNGDTELRFRLQVIPSIGALTTMHFNTTQRYDLLIRDANGNKVWQHSAGKAFLPVLGQLNTANIEITVPLDSLPGRTIRPGLYSVDAWVTTTDENPRFAASIGMTVPDFGQPQPGVAGAVDRTFWRGRGGLPLPGRSLQY